MKRSCVKKWQCYARYLHWWSVPAAALPLLLVICTGIGLLVRREVEWMQPATRLGSQPGLSLPVDELLPWVAQRYPEEAKALTDIKEIRILPAQGVTKIRLANYREIQVDSHSGAILHEGYTWSSLLVALHEGSFFSLTASYVIFLPASILLLVLWISGISILLGSKRWKRLITKKIG